MTSEIILDKAEAEVRGEMEAVKAAARARAAGLVARVAGLGKEAVLEARGEGGVRGLKEVDLVVGAARVEGLADWGAGAWSNGRPSLHTS